MTVDVEVKTGGFEDISTIRNMAIPAVLLDDEGRKEFLEYCGNNSIHGYMPRVLKLKDLKRLSLYLLTLKMAFLNIKK